MTFNDIKFDIHTTHLDGVQGIVKLDNGYEISVIKTSMSHGGDKGFYEIGVFDWNNKMCDPMNWGDDVKGWLTEEQVELWINLISKEKGFNDQRDDNAHGFRYDDYRR